MKHPIQSLVAGADAQSIFTVVKNQIRAYRYSESADSSPSCTLIGSWDDEVEADAILKKQQKEKIKQLELQKKSEDEVIKIPKIPTPGPGAPAINSYIRSLDIFCDKFLVATTDNDKAVVIFRLDYAQQNCLVLVKRQPLSKRPCSISMDAGNENVIVADKFGDVYAIPTSDGPAVDEKSLSPVLGHVSMLTDVLMAQKNGKQFILTADRDEHIRVSNYPKAYVVKQWLFGHNEYVSSLHIPSAFNASHDTDLLVSGGGDDFICLWNWYTNELFARADLRAHLAPYFTDFHNAPERFATETSLPEISVSKIISISADHFVVLVENVKCLLLFKIEQSGDEYSLAHKQTLELAHPLVDVVSFGNSQIIGSNDTEDGNLLSRISLSGEQLELKPQQVSGIESIDVESREQFSPIWYVNSLRKRSEH